MTETVQPCPPGAHSPVRGCGGYKNLLTPEPGALGWKDTREESRVAVCRASEAMGRSLSTERFRVRKDKAKFALSCEREGLEWD